MQKMGEGAARSEGELPIDVHYEKLVEWLVDRKKLPSDWRKRLAQVQARAATAMRKLPANLVAGEDLEAVRYEAVARVLGAVDREGGPLAAKNLLGQRTGAARELEVALAAYKKHKLHWGEAAQFLMQHTDYEVPFLQKQMSKSSQQLEDLTRKETDTKRGIATCKAAYASACAQLGITGDDTRRELKALPEELAEKFQSAVTELRAAPVVQAVQCYRDFIAYAHPSDTAGETPLSTIGGIQTAEEEVATTDLEVLKKMLVGKDEGSGGAAIPIGINWDLSADDGEADSAPVEIDWGVSMAVGGEGGADESIAINWDIDVQEAAPVEINWDIGAADEATDAAAPAEINWDIGVTDSAGDAGPVEIDWGIGVASAVEGEASVSVMDMVVEDSAASQESLPSKLLVADFRNRCVEDLLELQAFLKMRQTELASLTTAMQRSSVPKSIQHMSQEQTVEMVAGVEAALAALTARRTQDLLLIQAAGRYFERLVASLDAYKGQEVKLKRMLVDVDDKRQEIRGQISTHGAREKVVLGHMQQLKASIEMEISGEYKGRPVNIIGAINNLLG